MRRVIEPEINPQTTIELLSFLQSSGQLSQGHYVDKFETSIASFLGVDPKSVVVVSSGTAALYLAVLMERNKKYFGGVDAVKLPASTFVACGNVVKQNNLNIEFVDSDPKTWNAHSCLIGVDLFGNPLSGSMTIEDAAEALGSVTPDGRKCGTLAQIGCLSFFENKIITSGGEGGALVCQDPEDAKLARLLRQQGKDYSMKQPCVSGYNFRLTELQAIIGIEQLREMPRRLGLKRRLHDFYVRTIKNAQFQEEWGKSNWWLNCILVPEKVKKRITAEFDEVGIAWRELFTPLYHFPWLTQGKIRLVHSYNCPVAESLWKCGIGLPSSITLDEVSREHVAKVVNRHV